MLLQRLVDAWEQMSATRSRNAKRAIIAEALSEATGADIEIVVSYLSGALRQRRTGIGWRALQDVPQPASEPQLTVPGVDAALARIAALSGPGSGSERVGQVTGLFARATGGEQDFLRGLISGEPRQGALEAAVQDGLAAAFQVSPATVRRAAMLLGSTPATARLLYDAGTGATDRLAALRAVHLTVGVAVYPMLATSAADIDTAVGKSGLPAVADAKLDGVRVQVHKSGATVRVFSRSLEEITDRMPQVVTAVADLGSVDLVLDGEAVALRPDGSPEAFQQIASSAATQDTGDTQRLPLRAYFFDLLRVDGADLLDRPLAERHEIMRDVVPGGLLIPRILAEDRSAIHQLFDDVVGRGFEGVVIKNRDAPYAAGRRDAGWIKVKPRHTFDLVVIAAEWGHGRRQGWLSNLHLAARDPERGELVMLGKTFKGLTDEMLAWQTERFLELEMRRTRGTVHLQPEVVAEIACDGLQISPRYPGGVALRFARVLRYREDKTADAADTIEVVKRLLPQQSMK